MKEMNSKSATLLKETKAKSITPSNAALNALEFLSLLKDELPPLQTAQIIDLISIALIQSAPQYDSIP